MSSGGSPQHSASEYRLPGSDVSIETPRSVMPPGSRTPDVIGIVRAVSSAGQPHTVLDLGSGTGVLGIVALLSYQPMRGVLLEIDPEAAACSARNLTRLGLASRASAVRSDGASSLRPGSIELLIANPPYTPDAEVQSLPARFTVHPPRLAVSGGGSDGLAVLRQLAPAMAAAAAPGCRLILQLGNPRQKAAAAELMSAAWEPVGSDPAADSGVLLAVRRSGSAARLSPARTDRSVPCPM